MISGFAVAPIINPSMATVIEFDQEGEAQAADYEREPPSKKNSSKYSPELQKRDFTPRRLPRLNQKQMQLRELAAEIALRFAGHDGVVKAGLNSLTFIDLFTALIHRESNFEPEAVSPSGAKGLGQLMDNTARELKVVDVFDPHQNLDGSARYFVLLLARFKSAELALAAYNAGPGRVQRYGEIPPFPETKQYIVDVFQAAGLTADLSSILGSQNKPIPTRVTGEQSIWEY